MDIFEECLDLTRRIQHLEEVLRELQYKIRYPKSQSFSDMPKGSSQESMLEVYLEKQESIATKKLLLQNQKSLIWKEIEKAMNDLDIKPHEQQLMRLRYRMGFSWKKCTQSMKIEYRKWNDNKTFKVNAGVKAKIKTYTFSL